MTHKILNKDPKEDMLKAFRLFDDDSTGFVTFKNLKRVAKETNQTLDDTELEEMLTDADKDGDRTETCGGRYYESAYVMIECEKQPPSKADQLREKHAQERLARLRKQTAGKKLIQE